MATHRSAEKRHRQSLKRRDRNRNAKATFRTIIKGAKAAAAEGNMDAAKGLAVKAESLLAKAATKSIVHKKTASRMISRLSSELSRIEAQK